MGAVAVDDGAEFGMAVERRAADPGGGSDCGEGGGLAGGL